MRMTSVMEKNGTLLLPKSIYISHAVSYLYETPFEIWAAFGKRVGKELTFFFKAAFFGLEWAKTHNEFWVAVIEIKS